MIRCQVQHAPIFCGGPRRGKTRGKKLDAAKRRTFFSHQRSSVNASELGDLLAACGINRNEAGLQRAVDNSLCLVAVFAALPDQKNGAAGLWSPWNKESKRKLVGFGRSAGDAAVIATIHDVAVHPDFRGMGLGKKIVERLTRQLYGNMGICEVALTAPMILEYFFASAKFGPDPEGSTPMVLTAATEDCTSHLKSSLNERLLSLL
ncbi:hypothetical protein BSKO_01460 [Bryopsis sp. KO-2023]|nr:hypothetical protein BSKO_01460 [Bryopsis sp. KO-2023]